MANSDSTDWHLAVAEVPEYSNKHPAHSRLITSYNHSLQVKYVLSYQLANMITFEQATLLNIKREQTFGHLFSTEIIATNVNNDTTLCYIST
jgi:hypothetical protein